MARKPNVEQDESLVALKEWWDGNGKYLIAGVVVGLATVVGWFSWDSYRLQQLQDASSLYTQLVGLVETEATEAEVKTEQIERVFMNIQTKHSNTPYAILGSMLLARHYVMQADLDQAEAHLNLALEFANEQEIQFLQGLIAVRLARVLNAQGKPDEALDYLSSVELPRGLYLLGMEVIADSLAASGKKQDAVDVYRDSLEGLPDQTGYIRMKMQRLGVRPTPRQGNQQ